MTIGIIGYGRFGKLLHKNLKAKHKIKIYQKETAKDSLVKCDLVILAVPMNVLEIVVKEIKNKINKKAIIMDVCSVKVLPSKILKKYIKNNILATHPLFGPDSAKKGFFSHKMVFCPLNIMRNNFLKVKKVFTNLGVKDIICTPEEHDQMMARSQALVHFLGRSLKNIKPQIIATPDYYNLLAMMDKVWNDTWELFYDMQILNPYAEKERKKFISNVLNIEKKIYERSRKIKKRN